MRRMWITTTALAVSSLCAGALAQAQRPNKPTDVPGTAATLSVDGSGGNQWTSDGSTAAATSCARPVLVNDNSASGNGRAPSTRFRFIRCVYLITATEMAAAGYTPGTSPTTIGWNYSTAPGVAGSAPLTVYMENTADTTNTKSTTWATAIGGMTVVHSDPATALPGTAGPFDITLTGGSPFTYTGGGLYVAFDWGNYAGTLSTAAAILCNSTGLVNGLLSQQSNTAAPTTTIASSFRPETRLNGVLLLNDAAVTYIYSLGEMPPCLVGQQTIRANVINNGADTLTNLPVTLTITGANSFTDTQTVPTLAPCGGQATVLFAPYTPGAIGNGTVTVSVPADTVSANNSLARSVNNTQKAYSHKFPGSTASGGVGLTGASGAFVARFSTSAADAITDVKLEFPAVNATTYRVAIYGESLTTPGTPAAGTPLYLDAADRTIAAAGPVTITLPSPVAVGPGNFFVGIQQTNTTNAGLSFDAESPIRTGTFFFATALPVATWIDFAPNNIFKLNIGVLLQTGCIPPACVGDIAPGGGNGVVDVADLLEVIGHWGACPGACPPACIGDFVPPGGNCNVDVADLLGVVGHWGPCP